MKTIIRGYLKEHLDNISITPVKVKNEIGKNLYVFLKLILSIFKID